MLPQLSPLSGGQAGTPVRVPPPPNFRPVCGEILWTRMEKSKWIPPRGDTPSKRAGMVYEDRVHCKLSDLFADAYLKSPCFEFKDSVGHHRCVADGLIRLSPDVRPKICLVEIKLSHTPNAWWQLRKLYGPVCQHYFNSEPVVLEICKNYEAGIGFPEPVQVVYEIFDFVLNAKPDEFGVLRWKM